jgi:NAD+ kinase
MLRAMRISDGQHTPVLGVNLGKLGFLAEVDVADLPGALSAIDHHDYVVEARTAVRAVIADQHFTAFNDVVAVRIPGDGVAAVGLSVQGQHFVNYAADAVIVSTPTGSTAYSFSAGGPIVSPSVAGLIVIPSAPHSAFNRAVILDCSQRLALVVLPTSGQLAVEVDGQVLTTIGPGDVIEVSADTGAGQVIRLGHTTFYQRAQRKLRLTGSAEVE